MGEQLRIRLLGELQIILGDEPVTGLPSRAAEALLVYVACQEEPVSRERLADLLWDDRDPKQAAANLRSVLSSLRRALGDFLNIERQNVSFRHDRAGGVDILQFRAGLAALPDSSRAETALEPAIASRLEEILALYRGDFLSGFYLREGRGFEEWAALMRERLRRQVTVGLRRLLAHRLVVGDYAQGLTEAHRLLDLDPYSEEAHRQLMLLLARTGQRAAALQQYARCRQLLDEDLGVPPLEETTALYERLRASRGIGSHNLPPQPTPFVGRRDEIAALRRRLAHPDCRLLTLLGPGGIGKTRLALQVAQELLAGTPGMFLDGIWFVSLTAVRSTQFLATTIAETLDVVFHGPSPPERQLEQAVRERELLLILDNMEQLLEDDGAVRLLEALLSRAPALKLLVTSRQRLNLREEWVHDVGGLGLPADVGADDADGKAPGAVQLFLQNARRLRWDFAPSHAERRAIVRICRLLDGMPLGLELASAWIRQHDPEAIAESIAAGLDFLTTPWRNQPDRHRSLRAVFRHSWELLSPTEQASLRRLSCFVSAFDGAQAMAVAGASGATLAGLVDQSLLRRAPGGRYDWHPLVRRFAGEHMEADAAEAARVARGHAAFFASFLAEREPRLNSPDESALIAEIEPEIDNILAAWGWALDQGESDLAGQMLFSLAYYYDHRSLFQTGLDVFSAALATPAAAADPLLAGRLHLRSGRAAFRLGQIDASRLHLETALGRLAESPSARDRYLSHGYLAELERLAENLPASLAQSERCLEVARRAGDIQGITLAYLYLGNAYIYSGQFEPAQEMYEMGLSAGAERCSPRQLATYLDNLGTIARERGDYERARERFRSSLEIRERLNDRWGMAISANNVAVAVSDFGKHAEAEQQFKQAILLFREIGHPFGLAQTFVNLGGTYQALGRWGEAREILLQSIPIWHELGQRWGLAQTLEELGAIALEQRDGAEAHRLLTEAVAIQRQLENPVLLAQSLSLLAVAETEIGELTAAEGRLREALALSTGAGALPAQLQVLFGWAVFHERRERADLARPLLRLVADHPATKALYRQRAADRWQGLDPAPAAAEPALTLDEAIALLLG